MPRSQNAVAMIDEGEQPNIAQENEARPAIVQSLTPERQRLADAIATVADLEAGIAEAGRAIGEAEEASLEKSRAQAEAERVLERAKPRPVSDFTLSFQPAGAFWGSQERYDARVADQDVPPIPISEARDALARATDEYDSARRLIQFHRDRQKRMEDQLSWKRGNIRDAARAVVRAEPALLALAIEAKRLATRARAAAYAFEQATGGDVIQPGSPFYGCTQPSDFRTDYEGWAVSRAWREALDALQTNATTPLPMVGA